MTGKTATSTSTVQVPADVLARYDAVNAQAQTAASTPFQQYSSNADDFVAPLSATQQAGIQNTNTAANQAQPYYADATGNLLQAQGQALGYTNAAASEYGQAQSAATPYYGAATDDLTQAQANASPYYGAATGALGSGAVQAQNLYGSSNALVGAGLAAASPYNQAATGYAASGAGQAQNLYGSSNALAQAALNTATPYDQGAAGLARAGTQQVNAQQIGAPQINQFLSPYLGDVAQSTEALQNQENQQQMAGQLGNAITSGAFGGDRAGIAAANLSQQQELANSNVLSGILNTGYNTALGAAQQQQGVNLGAAQANRSALQTGSTELANVGQQLYGQTAGAGAQLASNAQGLYGVGSGTAATLGNIGQQEYAQNTGAGAQLASNAQGIYGVGSGTASGLENIGQGTYNLGANTATALGSLGQGLYGVMSGTASGLENVGNSAYNIGAGTANSLAGLGSGAQSAALQGATAQLTAGQQEQSTQQAGLTALYNQFLQQQAYPFQTAQFAANVAEGTGSLSGSTTSTTQPTGLFGNLLSDRRAKEDIKVIGKAKNGLPIYTFKYKGDPDKVTHIGFMADEVEKKHPEAVGLAGGLKTVDYERAARADGGGLVFDPNAGAYGLSASGMPGSGTYVPAPQQSAARRIAFQSSPRSPQQQGLGALANQYTQLKGIYNDGSQIYDAGKSVVAGLNGGATYARGGLALKRDDGGVVDDPFESDLSLQQRERGLVTGEGAIEQAPNTAANGPVSGALASQATSPKYSLGSTPQASNNNSGSGLAQLASLATLSKDVAPYALEALALKAGGLVRREHHADGSVVGGDDDIATGIYSPEDPRLWSADPPAPIAAANDVPVPPVRPKGLGAAPMVSPDDVSKQPDLDPSKLDVPTPPVRPRDLDAPSAAPTPGLSPTPRYLPPAARTMDANVAPSSAEGAWAAPTYNGARPSAAPDPSAYGTDQGGQAAFIRDYAAYRGIRPDFALSVANAEGLRAISPQNPNGASSVDIDPKTGKPFSFGAFQLNVRNGLGNVAMANGIDPTNPDHANLANRFAIDQMASGGLKPWQGDAAVKAYQQSQQPNGGGAGDFFGNVGHSIANGVSGLGNAVGGMFGGSGQSAQGQPQSGGMGERALMAVLSGLGALGSYRGQSGLGAVLQGLGGGAQGWMNAGKTQAEIANTQADVGLKGAETARTNVNAARESVLPDYGYVLGPDGNLHTINKNLGTPSGIPLMGGVPNAATKTVAAPGTAPPATASGASVPASPAAPAAPAGPDLTGVGYDTDSAAKAHNEVLAGPQAKHDIDQSAAYQDATRRASLQAQESATYTRPLVSTLAQAYQQTGVNAPGAGFTNRAAMVNTLNTTARSLGLPDSFFGDSDKGEVLANKINTLQGLMRSQGAGEHSLGAFEMLKGANASLDQPPQASAEIAAHLLTDQMRAQDREKHAEQWKADSPTGTVLGAQDDFQAKNGPQKYDRETSQLSNLMLNQGKYVQGLNSGDYTPQQIANSLKKHGFDPALARYFVRGP